MYQDKFWDVQPYKQGEQLLAAINCCKGYGDTRVLRPLDEYKDVDILSFTAQHYEPEWQFIQMTDEDETVGVAGSVEAVEAVEAVDVQFMVDLVACLGAPTATDRKRWINMAIFLKSQHRLYDFKDAWLALSAKSLEKKYDGAYATEKVWDDMHIDNDCKKPLNMGTLVRYSYYLEFSKQPYTGLGIKAIYGRCRYARSDDPVGYRRAMQARETHRNLRNLDALQPSPATNADARHVFTLKTLLGIMASPLDVASARVEVKEGLVTFDAELVEADIVAASVDRNPKMSEPGRYIIAYDKRQHHLKVQSADDPDPVYEQSVCKAYAIEVETDLACINKHIPSGQGWSMTRPSDNNACFRNTDKTTTIELLNVDSPGQEMVRVDLANGVNGALVKHIPDSRSKPNIALLHAAYNGAVKNDALTRLGMGWAFVSIVGDNNNVTLNLSVDGNKNKADNDFDIVRDTLLAHASAHKKMKAGGLIYGPVEGCPCAYVPEMTYEVYVNTVLAGNRAYLSHPRRFKEAMDFLAHYRVAELPEFEPDRNVLSVRNGIFLLKEDMTFVPYDSLSDDPKVARHHIDLDFDPRDLETPLFDKVLLAQFGEDVVEILRALIGRLFFEVSALDNWQVMPYLVGVGGAGKSLILLVIERLFKKGAVGNLAAKREDVFGMANLVGKEVVIGRDMPAKLSGSLSQEIMQCMTSGEGMEIPRKNDVAMQVPWTIPTIMGSNHMPDYVNTGNNIGRRFASFRFDNIITDPQEDIFERICREELVNIAVKSVRSYHALRAKVRVNGGGFWKNVPAKMLEWQGKLAAATNKLHAFLTMESDKRRGYEIAHAPGRITWLLDFETVFREVMDAPFVSDAAVFANFRFKTSEKSIMVCIGCKQLPLGRGTKCCPEYAHDRRRLKNVIYDMTMTRDAAFGARDSVDASDV